MANLYYIIEGENPKGPYSAKEIRDFNLNESTLIWKEGFESPVKLADIAELNTSSTQTSTKTAKAPHRAPKSRGRIIGQAVLTLFFVAVLSAAIVYIVSAVIGNRKEKQRAEINTRINELFDGKTALIDGHKTEVSGEFIETGYRGNRNRPGYIKTVANSPREEWWEEAKLYTVYKCLEGGFTLKKLSRTEDDNRFELDIYESSDMGYTRPVLSSSAGTSEFLAWMKIFMETYTANAGSRTDVQFCYDNTFDLLAEKSKSDAFTPGKLADIENFDKISNTYYFIKNLGPKVITPVNNATFRKSATGEVITNVSADDYTVYYSNTGYRYELAENDALVKQDIRKLSTYALGAFYLLVAFSFILKYIFFRK